MPFKSLLSCLLLLVAFSVHGQVRYTADQQAEIKAQTENLFNELVELAQKRHYQGFAQHMIYNGRNPNRNLQAKINYNDPFDRLTAENTLNFLRNDLKKSALWHTANFKIVQGHERDLFIWQVEFTTLKGKIRERRLFFARYKGEYLLARIEK